MGGDRIARPDRADLARGLIADGKDEIHDRRAGASELVPAFAAHFTDGQAKPIKQVQRQWMHCPLRKAAGAIALEAAPAPMVEQRLGEDAPRRVAGAQEQHVVDAILHDAGSNGRLREGSAPIATSIGGDCYSFASASAASRRSRRPWLQARGSASTLPTGRSRRSRG